MILTGVDRKTVNERFVISRIHLYVLLKREKSGEGLKSSAGRGCTTIKHPENTRFWWMSRSRAVSEPHSPNVVHA